MSTTPAKQTEPTWDDRGVCLDSLTSSLFVADDEQWVPRIERMGFPSSKPTKDDSWNVAFFALPEPVTRSSLYLSVEIHPHEYKGKRFKNIHLLVKQRAVPSTEPPAKIRESSKQVGGFPDAWNRLAQGWPENIKGNAEITVSYFVDSKIWSCNIPKSFKRKIKTPDGKEIALSTKALSWNVDPIQHGISKVIISPSESFFYISVDYMKEELAITKDVLKSLDEELWALISKLFMTKVSARSNKRTSKKDVQE